MKLNTRAYFGVKLAFSRRLSALHNVVIANQCSCGGDLEHPSDQQKEGYYRGTTCREYFLILNKAVIFKIYR